MNPTIYGAETLDCQQCGEILLTLSPTQAQKVADSPYNFILYCTRCKKELER